MNSIFSEYARTEAPDEFAVCVRTACQCAVNLPITTPSRRPRLILIAAALILLVGSAAAAVITWMADDLFTEESGFMLPDVEWGSSASIPREEKLSLYGCTADVSYQYENDSLICVDVVFHRQNQPDNVVPDSLAEQLIADMTRLYGEPEDLSQQIDGARLQQALREYLAAMEAGVPEEDRPHSAYSTPAEADCACDAVSQSPKQFTRYNWTHEKTNTAAWLSVSYDSNHDVRVLEISLACLNF